MPIHKTSHPLIDHKMTRLRDTKTTSNDFRKLLREITFYLGYEASRNIKLQPDIITTPINAVYEGSKIDDKIAIVPILRAGLGMSEAMLELMPNAVVHHIGIFNSFFLNVYQLLIPLHV
jgi:uracil phosphoribosyltransferase